MFPLHRRTHLDEYVTEILLSGLEVSPTSEHLAAPWSEGIWPPICDGFRVDGKWKHQRAHYNRKDRKISYTELVRVITGHKQGPDQYATQLVDVVNGLAFMRDRHVIHGELRGVSLHASRSSTKANILINRYQRSSLISNNTLMSLTARGTYRWMSP